MKNIFKPIGFTLLLLATTALANAQINPNTRIKKLTPKDPSNEILNNAMELPRSTMSNWFELYPAPNFQGRPARYSGSISNFTYPFSFTNKRELSLKIATGYIAYISLKDEFNGAEEHIYTGNVKSLKLSDDIKSIRVEWAAPNDIFVTLCGFATQIHNNDCKRVFGNIKVLMYERNAAGMLIQCPLISTLGVRLDNERLYRNVSDGSGRTLPYYQMPGRLYNRSNNFNVGYIYDSPAFNYSGDSSSLPVISRPVTGSNGQALSAGFRISQKALNENRVILRIICDLGVQHKTNDASLDFSSNVKMGSPRTFDLYYKELPTNFSIGDIVLHGLPDNTLMASGGINKKLRVYFTKALYNILPESGARPDYL